jgi:hypothetical protein
MMIPFAHQLLQFFTIGSETFLFKEQATKFELVINLKTAFPLGISMRQFLLGR